MYRPNCQPTYPLSGPYLQSNQITSPFQQQQFNPRFHTPLPSTPPGSYYPSPQQHHDYQRPPFQGGPVQPRPFYQPAVQSQLPNQNFGTPNTQYPPPCVRPGFNQMSIPYRTASPIYKSNQNYIQPPPPPPPLRFNQNPVQNYNNCPQVQNYNQPPPVQNYKQSILPSQSVCPNINPFQTTSSGYGQTLNIPYQPQVQSHESMKQPYNLPTDKCYQQQQSLFNVHRHEFNPRPQFNPPEQQRFPFINQNPRYQQPQHGNNRVQFNSRQQYRNHRPTGPSNFCNQPNDNNNVHKKDKISCKMDNCDFVGYAAAIKEHQNLHHRSGLHKKVLYSNNSDAIKNWIEERKKKWPTKETIRLKSEVEIEKIKRGERIGDEDFQRFNKKNKFNNSGSKRFNNKKRPRFNNEFKEPVEDPINGNLKRFAGIVDIQNDGIVNNDETNKPIALKLLEEYTESGDNQSDDEPPEETAIIKTLVSPDHKNLTEDSFSLCSTSKIVDKEVNSDSLIKNDSTSMNIEVKIESCTKVNEECEKVNSENGQKQNRTSKTEFKPLIKVSPLRTPRTEIVERKGALLEALMGDLMRSERNAITQCICFIRKNMQRFCKNQAA